MKSLSLMKIAASSIVLGGTVAGCSPIGQASHPASLSDAQNVRMGAQASARAAKALNAKDFATAVAMAEAAVGAMPRDASYRVILGRSYLGAGRFASAESAFSDTLMLSPDDGKAALNLALAQIAGGKKTTALGTLADYRDRLPSADYGLALALAGDLEGATSTLEAIIRSGGADAHCRQNLALVYALAGKWTNARVMAVQDLSPADADARMIQWMGFVHPSGYADQVASLLGVTPTMDAGQPSRLALVPVADMQVAAAAPVVSVAAPVKPVPAADNAPAFEIASVPVALPPAKFVPATKQVVVARQDVMPVARPQAAAPRPVQSGKFVVQLGAYSNASRAEDAWNRSASRFGLSSFEPASAVTRAHGAELIRLSVGGFGTRTDAVRVCTRIQKAGGSCFVRGIASDAPAQWVQRGMPKFAGR